MFFNHYLIVHHGSQDAGKKNSQMPFKFQLDRVNVSVLLFISAYSHHKSMVLSLNNGAPKYMKQNLTELKGEIHKSTAIVGDFNTLLSIMDRTTRHKINKEIEDLNCTINQLDLIEIYRICHLAVAEYTFCLSTPGTFSKTDHMLGHKIDLNELKRNEII